MANKDLFKSSSKKGVATNTVNNAGGEAYSRSAEGALAQFAATGMFSNTYYTDAKSQLDEVLKLAKQVSPEFLAKVAIYSRNNAYLKDMPALLVAVLSTKNISLFKEVFPRVIDNGRMLRNFVQIIRSGVVGRTSLGSAPKKVIQKWFRDKSSDYLFKASVGNSPSLVDVIKMVHPRPETKEKEALYGYLLGKDVNFADLPKLVQEFESFKDLSPDKSQLVGLPDVPFQMLTALNLSNNDWKEIAKNGAWQFTRMNLNTFKRHGVFEDPNMVSMIAERLIDAKAVKKARQYPYQVYSAYQAATDVPMPIKRALHKAVELCAGNVPAFEGKTAVLIDVSASMTWAGPGKSKNITCADVAGLFAAIIVNRNDESRVYAFDTGTTRVLMNPLDSIFTNAERMKGLGGGGTDVSSGLKRLIDDKYYADNVVIISDNESWADMKGHGYSGTGAMEQFDKLKKLNPKARMILIDLTPGSTTQVLDRKDILNVGGFSDSVFDVISSFSKTTGKPDFWVDKINTDVTL